MAVTSFDPLTVYLYEEGLTRYVYISYILMKQAIDS